jgi:hypothetical protein
MGDLDNCFFLNLTTISQIFIAELGYKHFMLENRNISINMGTEALVAGKGNSRNTCIHIKISPCLGLQTMDQTAALLWLVHSNTKNQDYHLFILTIPL